MRTQLKIFGGILFALAAISSSSHAATSVDIDADRDNTLYESISGALSNGAGSHFFAGTTSGNAIRRGLVRFDVAGAIPAGVTITSATLTLNMSRSRAGTYDVSTHRALADWGEGTSDAGGQEGGGATSTTGDATWIHTFYSGNFWSSAGGDYGAASATIPVAGIGSYAWTGSGIVADVQDMLDDGGSNFGWALVADESTTQTATRFDSRENVTVANRPVLSVTYEESGVSAPTLSEWGVGISLITLMGILAGTTRNRLALNR